MKKEILILGIIFLFIGVGIQPAFAIEISNIKPSENVEDCNCGIADNYDTVRVKSLLTRAESLLNRVEIFTNIIPLLYKDTPEVIKDCEKLSEKISTFREMNEELNTNTPFREYPIICGLLYPFFVITNDIGNFLDDMCVKYRDNKFLLDFFSLLLTLWIPPSLFMLFIMLLFGCPWLNMLN